MDTLYQLLEWNPVQVGSTFQGGHVDVPATLHTGLDATLCYAGDVARGGGGLGWGGHVDVPVTLHMYVYFCACEYLFLGKTVFITV